MSNRLINSLENKNTINKKITLMENIKTSKPTKSTLQEIAISACKTIAPLWSLENFVAVNPYFGLSNYHFDDAATLLAKTNESNITLPLSFYTEALEANKINKTHIALALKTKNKVLNVSEKQVEDFILSLYEVSTSAESKTSFHSYIDFTGKTNGMDINRLMINRISEWASSYFDNKTANWQQIDNKTIYASWKYEAAIDLSTEIAGLKNFRAAIKTLSNRPEEVLAKAVEVLGIPENGIKNYFATLLRKVGGWSSFVARIDWDCGLAGQKSDAQIQFLAILCAWEVAVLKTTANKVLSEEWQYLAKDFTNESLTADQTNKLDQLLTLQKAFDIANQQNIIAKINNKTNLTESIEKIKKTVQAIFCIDVRSEVYRRHLEAASNSIETMGFAGFFAFPIKYVQLGHEEGNSQCPVLLTTSHTIKESLPSTEKENNAKIQRNIKHHIAKAWNSFKTGAISCFSFVGPVGLAYLPKLFTDSFGITRTVAHPDKEGISDQDHSQKDICLDHHVHKNGSSTGIPMEEQIKMAETALRAMSLTSDFGRLILIVGHGSSTVNNPYATGLDCGACGGHTGESNAKVAAKILNKTEIRTALHEKGINIPSSTIFLACLHDTTTDIMHIYNENKVPLTHKKDLENLKQSLETAGKTARAERALRMNLSATDHVNETVLYKSQDWSEVRPEWGLAGCSSFIVANRNRSKGLDLQGKSFLHSYDWKNDKGFGILELIMTAPMVVTSWINLQYYASTVDNEKFGSGNKLIHNVVGGLGVIEGYGGDLKTGLPWQSVHDGKNFQHEPLKLNVIIEAPIEQLTAIIQKHEMIRQLCDNEWIYLFAMNEEGKVSHQYKGELEWEMVA